ncbi:hypothetical protein HYY71_07205 [Candidatus Woesearchaeota archaeon]|nr:hypothetical protein [Candidatus Woesearchaeota archaeon]
MNKRYYVLALLVCLILLVSACKKSGAASTGAPTKPFIGGTSGLTISFLKDNPQPEVTDDDTFAFKAIVSLKNEGEFQIRNGDIKANLVGFDPTDFDSDLSQVINRPLDDGIDLSGRRQDAEGNIVDGETAYISFPKDTDFRPRKFSGNTEFTFRADVCYAYQTKSNAKLCILRDMINVRDDAICKPTGSRTVYSTGAPVQVTNFRQSVVGKEKISFSFDISLSGNVDIFRDKNDVTPSSGFDSACPRDPRKRREVENKVKIQVKHIPPSDPIITNIKCGGLESGDQGIVTLVNGKRTLTCTADLDPNRNDLEKVIEVVMDYNVLDNKETKVLVKHLADTT